MFYFYILQCADNKHYYGHTANLRQRLSDHQSGKNKATQPRRPLSLVYFEELDSRTLAIAREKQFKNGKTRKSTIDKLINTFSAERLSEFL
ncbi:MAG: GIY-YIG nuclease family protein [Candidatus Pacebacteria bacterium]|nr:GIY-YIG nuclease family protein [Candidatus Paceibacterota bacterium]